MDQNTSPSSRAVPLTASNSGAVPAMTGTVNPAAWKLSTRRMRRPARKFIMAPAAKTKTFFQNP